jgi:hypothetical protein
MLAGVDGGRNEAQEKKDANPLPLTKVVLYNSGVGFYEHNAKVDGDKQVDLRFNVEDVNDLLKSMVLQDFDGGKIATVNYASRDPITKTLKTFAIDLTENPTLADLLRQVRGQRIQIEQAGAKPIEGVIIGLERRTEKVGDDKTVETDYLNLLTDAGLRSFSLNNVASVKLLNEALDRDLRQALMTLALGQETDKKTVSVSFVGKGERRVRVGYVQQSPIWKTSYRLVLADKKQPTLQGWALVENTTEQDWNNVSLTMVSGRPISFVMNLYEPLYVQRQVVEPELFASLRSQTYGQDLRRGVYGLERENAGAAKRQAAFTRAAPAAPPAAAEMGGGQQIRIRESAGDGEEYDIPDLQNLALGVMSSATASNLGELFQYVVDSPVTLPRQQSAMLPIVQAEIKGDKVIIYNPAVHAKHPLNGLKLKNTTDLHLMQGPITVFDAGAYAGDARIEDIAPGGERLISYAMDLDTEVSQQSKFEPEQLVSLKIVKGVIITSRKYERKQTYLVRNSGGADKNLLIEMPLDSSWKLVMPEKPTEKTRDRYRFAVNATAGKPVTFDVEEEQIVEQQVAATNLDDNMIQYYQRSKVVSDSVKEALAKVVDMKREIERLTTMKQQASNQIDVIGVEQARIRQNMQQLDRNSDLYRQYVTKFSDQEQQIERLRGQIADLDQQINDRRAALDDFMANLNVI